MRGAGGTSGGGGQFFLGLVMMCSGFYLLLNNVVVSSSFGLGSRLFGIGGVGVTGGAILVPLVIGIAMIFSTPEITWAGCSPWCPFLPWCSA